MDLYDPARPQTYDRPRVINSYCWVPHLSVWPLPDGKTQITAMLPIADNEYKQFIVKIDDAEVSQLLRDYRDDPETTLAGTFGWRGYTLGTTAVKPPSAKPPTAKPTTPDVTKTLAALGL